MSWYESAPNDVWSLGVILVNLTCGRNPWKRASPEDSTFRAYLKDPHFLKSILPLTDEMICILSRIFECDPRKRITIPELRTMILECPQFTIPPWVSINGPMPVDFVNHPQVPVHHIPSDVYDSQSSVSSGSSHYSDSLQSAVSDASSFTEGYPDVDSVSSMSSVGLDCEADCKNIFAPTDSITCSDFVEPLLMPFPHPIPVPAY
ncbi:hypothetical protein APSETT445_001967 [Aspergillus pseudonomiae]